MSAVTNLAYPAKPFGQPGHATGPETPTVAALAVTASGAGLAYATFDATRPHDMEAGPEKFTFGYEVLRDVGPEAEFSAVLDRRVAECDLYAEVITGHDVAGMLEPLCSAAGGQAELPCLNKYATLWPNRRERRPPRGRAPLLVDTAFDLDISVADLPRTCAAAKLSSVHLNAARDTWRLPVTSAFASALLTAQSLGWCKWKALDLDPLVAESARERR
ncbi:hypothetical protein [Nocardia sp. NPDC004260]